jgi:hypothetical protein
MELKMSHLSFSLSSKIHKKEKAHFTKDKRRRRKKKKKIDWKIHESERKHAIKFN